MIQLLRYHFYKSCQNSEIVKHKFVLFGLVQSLSMAALVRKVIWLYWIGCDSRIHILRWKTE